MGSLDQQHTEGVDVAAVARRARAASRLLATLPAERRNAALRAVAYAIEQRRMEVLVANQRDCHDASNSVAAGHMTASLLKRLQTDEQGIAAMARSVNEVANLPDPLGRELAVTEL